MIKVSLTEHNIRRVFQRLLEIYQPIKRGEEDRYDFNFFTLESNMLKLHRKDHSLNSRRAKEAVDLALASINGYLNDIEYDISAIANPANLALMKALQMAYDPFVNKEIGELLAPKMDLAQKAEKKKVFEAPFKCLYRLRESIDSWMEMGGSNGYLDMVEDQFGPQVPYDMEMKWMVPAFE